MIYFSAVQTWEGSVVAGTLECMWKQVAWAPRPMPPSSAGGMGRTTTRRVKASPVDASRAKQCLCSLAGEPYKLSCMRALVPSGSVLELLYLGLGQEARCGSNGSQGVCCHG